MFYLVLSMCEFHFSFFCFERLESISLHFSPNGGVGRFSLHYLPAASAACVEQRRTKSEPTSSLSCYLELMHDGYRPWHKAGIIIHLPVCVCDGIAAVARDRCRLFASHYGRQAKHHPHINRFSTLRNIRKLLGEINARRKKDR